MKYAIIVIEYDEENGEQMEDADWLEVHGGLDRDDLEVVAALGPKNKETPTP